MKILVVDDEPVIRRVITEALERGGHRVLTARDGMEALELAELIKPDLVITDCDMPGKSGIQLAVELHQLNAGLPVLMLTGRDVFSPSERVLLNAHVARLVSKPVPLGQLAAMVGEMQLAA